MDEFESALDSIETYMKNGGTLVEPNRREIVVTPEELQQIVSDAVAHALAAYEQLRAAKNSSETIKTQSPSSGLRLMPPPSSRPSFATLQDEMGVDEIEFPEAPAPPAMAAEMTELAADMGVDGFDFNEAPAYVAAQPAPVVEDKTLANALAAWDDALRRLTATLEPA